MSSGNYDITVRAAGTTECIAFSTATINAPSAPVIESIITNNVTNCGADDGHLEIIATGNNLEYSIDNGVTFSNSPIFNNLSSGNYDISVREAGTTDCLAYSTAAINAPSAPVIENIITNDVTNCGADDGQLEIIATGNFLEYSIDNGATYSVSPVFNGLSSGNYDIAVREVGTSDCIAYSTAAINAPSAPVIENITTIDVTNCGADDGQLEIIATGNFLEYSIDEGITYFETPVFNDLGAGNYEIVVREVGTTECLAYSTATINAPSAPAIENVITNNVTNCGADDGQLEIIASGNNL